jgi:predicted RNA-binding protein with PUA-like domain
VVREGYPDETAFDPASPYHDPASTPDRPRWYRVDVRLVRRLRRAIASRRVEAPSGGFGDFALLRRGNRLSVLPVTAAQWAFVLTLETAPSSLSSARPETAGKRDCRSRR